MTGVTAYVRSPAKGLWTAPGGQIAHDDVVMVGVVTGTFDPLRLANFMRVLPRVLPVQLRRDGAVTEIVAAR